MVTESALVEEFSFMGIEKLDNDVIIKCIEIAAKYKLDAERIVEEWIAYAQTNLNGKLQPNPIELDTMVRKQLEKKQETVKTVEPITPKASKIKVYNTNKTPDMKHILNVYNTGTPKKNVEEKQKLKEEIEELSNFSPASYNPEVAKPSSAYENRSDRGKELEVFGPKHLLDQDGKVSTKFSEPVQIQFMGNHSEWSTTNIKAMYMFESLEVEASMHNKRIEKIGNILMKKYETQDNKGILTYGRVRCDGNGRLNAFSVLLETSLQHGRGETTILNLQQIQKFALFPGQIVLLYATPSTNNMRQNMLVVHHLYSNAIPELPDEKPIIRDSEPIKIIVACGPFTLLDNLVYQPLQDLIKYVITNQPHVLILTGPFVDMKHSSVADGTMAETYKTHFKNLMEQIATPLKATNIQVIVVPSTLDAHHHSVYPTPPFDFSKHNFHMASDPSIININNIIVGVTNADILFHLAKTEFTQSPYNTDRMARFAEHILSQRSFYPIYPPQESPPSKHRFSVDHQLMQIHGGFDTMPHILILPSNLGQFVKNVNGCIVINPQRMSKGYAGGSFASINVYPGQLGASVEQNITCRIIMI